MEIGLLQALLLGILAFLAGLDLFNGLTHFHRPVVLGPLVGLILGDLLLFSAMSAVMSKCDEYAQNADTDGIERVNYFALAVLGTFYFLCAFLPIYLGAEHAGTMVSALPKELIDGLGVAGHGDYRLYAQIRTDSCDCPC